MLDLSSHHAQTVRQILKQQPLVLQQLLPVSIPVSILAQQLSTPTLSGDLFAQLQQIHDLLVTQLGITISNCKQVDRRCCPAMALTSSKVWLLGKNNPHPLSPCGMYCKASLNDRYLYFTQGGGGWESN